MSECHRRRGVTGDGSSQLVTPTQGEVNRLLAYEAIRQLVARYAVAVDARDLDTLVGLFVDDVRVGVLGTGRDALRRSFDESLRGIGVSILNVGTHVIELVSDEKATGIVYCKGEIQDGSRWIHQAIVYEDLYRKSAGSWYFARRVHRLFYGAEVGANPLGLTPANWPEHHDGWGTLPAEWDSWRRFWADPADGSKDETNQHKGTT
jgi:ketosteroid isomerase-like protein